MFTEKHLPQQFVNRCRKRSLIVNVRRLAAVSAALLGVAGAATVPVAIADPAPGSKCDQSALYGVHIDNMSCMYGVWTSDGPEAAPGTPCSTPGDVRLATGTGQTIYWAACRGGVWSPYDPFKGGPG
jgi:hypothetical protein